MKSVRMAAYYLKYLAIYWVFAAMWLWSAPEKLTDPVPQWFSDQFGPTFVDTFPGLTLSWRLAGIAELVAGLLFLLSLVLLEFLPGRRKTVLLAALAVSACIFAYLGFGQRVTDQFDSAASLFFYFGATLVTWVVVRNDEREMVAAADDLDSGGAHAGR
jgi:peptidoglycan/LPS O-acetylase OafA/YrhL